MRFAIWLGVLLAMISSSIGTALAVEAYVPQFTYAKAEYGHYWLYDRGEKVAIFGPCKDGDAQYSITLIRRYPGHKVDDADLVTPEILHFVTRRGLGLMTYWVTNRTMAQVKPTVTFDAADPTRLAIHQSWANGKDTGTIDVVLRYDAELARYRVDLAYDLQVAQRGGGEFCNFYPHGLGDFRPEVGRYQRLIWQDTTGQLNAHWLSVIVPSPAPIRLPATGKVAYDYNPDGGPLVVFDSADPLPRVDICPCWFDAHLIWTEPADQPGPPYHYQAKLHAYWMTPKESHDLLFSAKPVSLKPFAERWADWVPVQMGMNDFEKRVVNGVPPVKFIYYPINDQVRYDTTITHSGRASLRIVSTDKNGVQAAPTGPELLVTPGKRVVISAWVKTQDVEGEGFWLETGGFERWAGDKVEVFPGPYQSPKCTGTGDWKRIDIEMPVTPPKAEWLHGRIKFILAGKGKVWLDDFEFREE